MTSNLSLNKNSTLLKKTKPKDLMKFISIYSLSYLAIFLGIFLYYLIAKFGHPSFYSITLWYIYFYGILNLYTAML